ncbi:MAG: nitroreductase family protein [Bacteriovoracaceae bacterium]|nr:nitroreductase family protein [Bacteriovoracaceae bacterium]
MEFFETVEKRRSIRRFTEEVIPESVIEKALEAAVLAPNSSNTQTWDFYWVRTPDKKKKIAEYCFNQSAARTASELIVVVANPKKWKRSNQRLINFVKEVKAPKQVVMYYEKLIPFTYSWGPLQIFVPFKWIMTFVIGLFRPITRRPNSKRDIQEVAIKSAALAAENFVLAMTAQGYSTCMMEGHDEWRIGCLLKLPCHARVVMVIGMGKEAERGTWGPRYRIPTSEVVHKI